MRRRHRHRHIGKGQEAWLEGDRVYTEANGVRFLGDDEEDAMGFGKTGEGRGITSCCVTRTRSFPCDLVDNLTPQMCSQPPTCPRDHPDTLQITLQVAAPVYNQIPTKISLRLPRLLSWGPGTKSDDCRMEPIPLFIAHSLDSREKQ